MHTAEGRLAGGKRGEIISTFDADSNRPLSNRLLERLKIVRYLWLRETDDSQV
jgi:hypothetical protein